MVVFVDAFVDHGEILSLIFYEERAFAIKTKYNELIELCEAYATDFFTVFVKGKNLWDP